MNDCMILSELGFVGFVDYRIIEDRREYFANPTNPNLDNGPSKLLLLKLGKKETTGDR